MPRGKDFDNSVIPACRESFINVKEKDSGQAGMTLQKCKELLGTAQ
jgi:hypothetical protein